MKKFSFIAAITFIFIPIMGFSFTANDFQQNRATLFNEVLKTNIIREGEFKSLDLKLQKNILIQEAGLGTSPSRG